MTKIEKIKRLLKLRKQNSRNEKLSRRLKDGVEVISLKEKQKDSDGKLGD